jgi:hypothetical protein
VTGWGDDVTGWGDSLCSSIINKITNNCYFSFIMFCLSSRSGPFDAHELKESCFVREFSGVFVE